MKKIALFFLTLSLCLATQAQQEALRSAIIQTQDRLENLSLQLADPATTFEQSIELQKQLAELFVSTDLLLEVGIEEYGSQQVKHRVTRTDELGAWLIQQSRLSRTPPNNARLDKVEVYWLYGLEKIRGNRFRVHAYVLPWHQIAYNSGDFRSMPGVKQVAREVSLSKAEQIMMKRTEILMGYVQLSLLRRSVSPVGNANQRLAPEASSRRVHVVQPGETLFSIAQKHGVEEGDIMSANRLSSTTIYTGQSLVIEKFSQGPFGQPAQSRLPDYLSQDQNQSRSNTQRLAQESPRQAEVDIRFRPLYHTITRMETLNDIAMQFGVMPDQLRDWNPYASFRPGEKIIVDMLAVD
jgi:LysM repeat protein